MKTRNLSAVIPTAPVEREKQFDVESAQAILKQFYHNAKREIKRNGRTTVNLRIAEQASHLTFFGDGFNLELVFTDKCCSHENS